MIQTRYHHSEHDQKLRWQVQWSPAVIDLTQDWTLMQLWHGSVIQYAELFDHANECEHLWLTCWYQPRINIHDWTWLLVDDDGQIVALPEQVFDQTHWDCSKVMRDLLDVEKRFNRHLPGMMDKAFENSTLRELLRELRIQYVQSPWLKPHRMDVFQRQRVVQEELLQNMDGQDGLSQRKSKSSTKKHGVSDDQHVKTLLPKSKPNPGHDRSRPPNTKRRCKKLRHHVDDDDEEEEEEEHRYQDHDQDSSILSNGDQVQQHRLVVNTMTLRRAHAHRYARSPSIRCDHDDDDDDDDNVSTDGHHHDHSSDDDYQLSYASHSDDDQLSGLSDSELGMDEDHLEHDSNDDDMHHRDIDDEAELIDDHDLGEDA